jgi:hypothetical protein
MRMDNETFRLKVENLFNSLRSADGDGTSRMIMAELEQLAATPRKSRYFLRAVAAQDDPALQEHFYRLVFSRVRTDQEASDLERHIRHMFYTDREHAKAILARVATREALPALFRVIALTEEGWLAGELIRIVLSAPPEELLEPLEQALDSQEYLLQCLAIYLIGKSGDDRHLQALARFYRRPVGEKLDRLEKKSLDALLEGSKNCSEELVIKWLRDKSSRVRSVALTIAQDRMLLSATSDIVSLVLIDPKTRSKAAATVLLFEAEGSLRLVPDHPTAQSVVQLIRSAKQDALQATLGQLMRDESPSVREVAVKLVPFLQDPSSLAAPVRRLAIEDRSSSVQAAALRALVKADRPRLIPVLIEIFTDAGATAASRDVIDVANSIMEEYLDEEEIAAVNQGVREKEEQRDAALDRFLGEVEWWRHDL